MLEVTSNKSMRYLRHTKFLTQYSPDFFYQLLLPLNKQPRVLDAVSLISQSREQILNKRPLCSQCSDSSLYQPTTISTEGSSGKKCNEEYMKLSMLRKLILDRKKRFSESTKAIMLFQEDDVEELSVIEEPKVNSVAKYSLPRNKSRNSSIAVTIKKSVIKPITEKVRSEQRVLKSN